MDFFPHTFEGEIVSQDIGSDTYTYTVVWLPDDLVVALSGDWPTRSRIVGEIDAMPISGALHPVGGRYYILLSKAKLKKLGKEIGEMVRVAFRVDAVDRVDVPDAIRDVIAIDDEFRDLWEAQTPGKQRSFSHMVASAKTEPTRQKRIDKVRLIMLGEIDMRGNPL
ncbi:MAG: YdeI/OmpD-associated family protein [Pseudomonadota bacterium]